MVNRIHTFTRHRQIKSLAASSLVEIVVGTLFFVCPVHLSNKVKIIIKTLLSLDSLD